MRTKNIIATVLLLASTSAFASAQKEVPNCYQTNYNYLPNSFLISLDDNVSLKDASAVAQYLRENGFKVSIEGAGFLKINLLYPQVLNPQHQARSIEVIKEVLKSDIVVSADCVGLLGPRPRIGVSN